MPTGVYERKRVPPEERFWAKVEKTETCWLWRGALNRHYGAFGVSHSEVVPAHRYAYRLARGPIPEGLTIDHLCRNRICVRPDHLEAVTLRENILRGNSPTIVLNRAGKCGRGHEFTAENTYVSPHGKRQCIACRNLVRATPEARARAAERARARRARKRAAEAGH